MHFPRLYSSLLAAVLAIAAAAAQAAAADQYELNLSPSTWHYTYSPDHKKVWLAGMSKVGEDGSLESAAFFSNSFGQPCITVQWGKRYDNLMGRQGWYWQWTAGPVYGYVAPYNRKVPLNYHGLSPVVVPSAGFQLTEQLTTQLTMLGNSALMLQFVLKLPER